MITWDKSIAIIKMTFGIAQSKMGELLGFDKTTISKVKSGKQPPPFSSEDVFEKIFNPHIENSPANAISTSEAYLLGVLKEIIQAGFPTVKTEMLDCWEETNYKVFVMELLGRTRQRIPQKQITGGLTNKGNLTPERMVDTFYQAINDYPVEDFMERNPVDSLSSDRIRDVISFVGHIRYKSQEDTLDKNEDIYQEILQFTDSLLEYLRFLKINSAMSDNFPEDYQPPRDDNEFVEAADHRRQQLISLYQALQEKVDKIMDEEYEQRRKEHDKVQ